MITNERIPAFYDWLSRYVQVSNWLAYRDRFASFTMHKWLDVPGALGDRAAGLEYVNRRLLEVAREHGVATGPRVLDAGCGFGGTIFHWHERIGGRYDGLTLSKVQIRVAERQARRRGIAASCRFRRRSYDAPLRPEYDVVVAIESLLHSADLCTTVPNLAGAVAPGGLLLILDDMATCDLDVARPADAALLRSHWGCSPYPRYDDYRAAVDRTALTVIHEENLSPLMNIRSEPVLDRLQRVYSRTHRAVPLPPVRTVLSAFLGGIGLERLHGSGDVEYRMIVARNDAVAPA